MTKMVSALARFSPASLPIASKLILANQSNIMSSMMEIQIAIVGRPAMVEFYRPIFIDVLPSMASHREWRFPKESLPWCCCRWRSKLARSKYFWRRCGLCSIIHISRYQSPAWWVRISSVEIVPATVKVGLQPLPVMHTAVYHLVSQRFVRTQ
jgi:hypothetical protein